MSSEEHEKRRTELPMIGRWRTELRMGRMVGVLSSEDEWEEAVEY
jgi:hypothetical protein